MKIEHAVMLAYDFCPSEGGIQTFMRSLVEADIGVSWTVLSRQADRPVMDCPDNVVRTAIRPQLRFVDKLWLKMRRGRFDLRELIAFQTHRKLTRLARRKRADFVFADQLCSALSVHRAARKAGIPWGVAVHGKELLDSDRMARELLGDADFVIANSTFTSELARARGAKASSVRILHPCVDTDVFVPPASKRTAKRELAIEGRETLVTVAHLVQRKGHELVIEALPALRAIYPQILYLIVGRGPYEGALRAKAAALGVVDAVRFCGYVSSQDLPLYYGAADIHVMPSTCEGDVEGFGIAFIEAAACGTPSVGSRSGGIPDAIIDGETGVLVESGSVDELLQAILRMLGDESLLDRMGYAARDRVEKQFSGLAFERNLKTVMAQIEF
jgi:phosphatidylinositol alpha-1,6-mannosyltransferase